MTCQTAIQDIQGSKPRIYARWYNFKQIHLTQNWRTHDLLNGSGVVGSLNGVITSKLVFDAQKMRYAGTGT